MQRRGNIEVQFNWIFVLIIGALILAFFGTLIYQQKASSESKVTHEILSKLDTKLSGVASSKNTFERIEMPDVEIKFIYPDYFLGTQRQNLKERMIFAPSSLRGDFLAAQTRPWNLGFDVATFIYLTNPTVKYYIVAAADDERFAQTIDSRIERKRSSDDDEELVRMEILSGRAESKGYRKVRMIFIGSDPTAADISALSNMPNSDVTALKVIGDLESGSLAFYKKSGSSFVADGPERFYVGEALLLGAIFVDGERAYSHLFDKAMKRLYIVSKIYENRTQLLAEYSREECQPHYLSDRFLTISVFANERKKENIGSLLSTVSSLRETYDEVIYASCPALY